MCRVILGYIYRSRCGGIMEVDIRDSTGVMLRH